MPSAATLAAFLLGSLAFVLVPGPSVFFIIGRAIALGRRAALATAAGNLAGVLVLLAAVSLGVGALVERVDAALTVLTYIGAAYLIWLGVHAVRHRHELATGLDHAGQHAQTGRAFREGALVGLTNPKAIVFFAAVLPQFVDASGAGPTTQLLVLGLVFCILASGMDALWAVLAGTARDWFASSPTRLRRLGGAGGLAMIGVGVGVAATGRHG